MISVQTAVNKKLDSNPTFSGLIENDLLNLTSFARFIKDHIEEETKKEVKPITIVMALKRYKDRKKSLKKINYGKLGHISIELGLTEISINLGDWANKVNPRDVFRFSSTRNQVTLLYEDRKEDQIITKLQDVTIVSKIQNLASITIEYSENLVKIPGIYYHILKQIASNNLNIIEVFSSYTELTLVFSEKDIKEAFSILKDIELVF